MQTFITDLDYYKSAQTIDPKRLGNQYYREGMTLLNGGWPNHPASRMWQPYLFSLTSYLLACQFELQRRGRWYGKTAVRLRKIRKRLTNTGFPKWLNQDFCSSHRSNLLRKDFSWYKQFGWLEPDNLPYIWPRKETL